MQEFSMRRTRRAQLGYDQQRHIEALEMIADVLVDVRDQLNIISRHAATISQKR